MFCGKCGRQIPDGSRFCPECGATVGGSFTETASNFFESTEKEIGSAIKDVGQTFSNGGNGQYSGGRLKTDRGLVSYILLSLVTLGIYSYYFIYKMAYDVNIACEGDGEKTSGLAAFIILSIVTCGIYAWIWYYKLGNRLASNAPRYNLNFQENGTTVILWLLIGSLLCGIGAFVAMHILIKNTNTICSAYNAAHGYY